MSASSRTSTGSKGSGVSVNPSGLSGDEIKVMRRSKEEFSRKGGWVRIFPSPDSWEFYGAYLQFSTNLNVVLYQQLYPERAAHLNMKSGGGFSTPNKTSHSADSVPGCSYARRILHTNSTLQVSSQRITSLNLRRMKPDSALSCALQRSLQYERKLKSSRCGHRRTNKMALSRSATPSDPSSHVIGESPDQARLKAPLQQGLIATSPPSAEAECGSTLDSEVTTSDSSVKQEVEKESAPLQGNARREALPAPKYNVVQLIENGKTMSKVQARFAFATYLMRVQHRLNAQTGTRDAENEDASNEQMDLVLRFLKRAAGNLHQTFRVSVPSRKLSIHDRRRILAKQLGDFVHIYNRETEILQQKNEAERKQLLHPPSFSQNEGLLEDRFNQFVLHASEAELEEVLTTYTKLNKSASIFLGSSSKSFSCPTQPQITAIGARSPASTTIGGSSSTSLSADGRKESGDNRPGGVGRKMSQEGFAGKTTKGVSHDSGRGEVAPAYYGPHPSRLASTSSFHSAMVAYSGKLSVNRQRPFSASSSQTSGSCSSWSRPQSASTMAMRPSMTSTHSRPGSGVAYRDMLDGAENGPDNNEQINDALRRLTVRQKQRQYTASRGSNILHQGNPESAPQPKTNTQSWSAFPFPDDPFPSRPIQTNVVLRHSKDHGYGYRDNSAPCPQGHAVESEDAATLMSADSSSEHRTAPMTASDTFHEFVNNSTYLSDAPGTSNGIYQPLAGSLQHQQIKQKRMLEQSKALLEQSKAKHQEMVAQAHAAHRSSQPSNGATNGANEPSFMQIYAPKPPPKPSSVRKPTSSHRVARRAMKDATTPHGFSLSHNTSRPHVRSTSALDAKRSMFDIRVAKSTHDYGQFYDGLPGGEDNSHGYKHMYSSDNDIGY
ncbi:Tubulin polyglutamylase TTLL5 [Lamellibrachia satsuma]|nr:Tubulin polyglutamylase TTLL5 [Lamellibrachia satsuma]